MLDYGYGIKLGPIEQKHLETMRNWRNDFRVRQWCRQYDLITEADQYAWYDGICRDKSRLMYLIKIKEHQPIGVCGLTSVDYINRRAEFSLYIGPEYHRRGYGKRALCTLLDHGFQAINLHLIWGETFDGNPAAHMFKGLGFNYEGRRQDFYYRDGRYIGASLYSITEAIWKQRGT